MVATIEPLLQASDLDVMPDDGNRYEIIEGELFVSHAPSIPHQRLIHNLQLAIGLYLSSNHVGVLIPGPGVIFSESSSVIPDLAFISEERQAEIAAGDKLTGAPDLIIEVLSPGAENKQRDRVVKRQLYGKYAVKEYWIVDPEDRTVEVYRRQQQRLEKVATLTDQNDLTSPLFPGFRVGVRDVFTL